MALLLMVAIIIGGLVNIPVKRIAHERLVPMHPLAVFGLGRLWPEMARERHETVIAVNLGGCVVPTCLAAYQLLYLAAGASTLLALWWSPPGSTLRCATSSLGRCRVSAF